MIKENLLLAMLWINQLLVTGNLHKGIVEKKVKNMNTVSKVYDPMTWQLKEIKPQSADYASNDSFEFGVNYLYSDTGNVFFNYTRALRTPTIQDAGAWYGPVKNSKEWYFLK